MMIETKIPVLPPGLSGEAQFILTLTIDEILWELESQPVQVRVEWWGQGGEECQIFTPVDVESFTKSKIGDVLYVRYEVRTSASKFTDYLRDANPLKVDVIDVHDQVVGSTLVHNLEQISETSCGFEGYYPVANSSSKEIFANLRIQFLLETISDDEEKASAKSDSRPRLTIRSRSKSSKSPVNRGKENARVQFSDSSHSVSPTRRQGIKPKGIKPSNKQTPLADSIVSELLNQSQELRRTMHQKLDSNFEGQNSGDEPVTEKPNIPSTTVESRYALREAIPSWNLPVERMRVLACVTKLEVTVASVQIAPVVLDKILNKDAKSNSSRPSRDTGSHAASYFVKFKLPGDSEETSFCTRRLKKGNLADFDEKRILPITFTSDTLEEWWNYKTEFKVYSRHLGQRVPLLIGEASLGMKYLLLHDRYTGGAPLSLPVYISNSLFRDLKLPPKTSEIVGNIHLSIQLSYRAAVNYRPGGNSCANDVNEDNNTSPRCEVIDPEQEVKSAASIPNKSTNTTDKSSTAKQREKVTISSRPRKVSNPIFEDTLYLEMRVSVIDGYDVFHVKHRNLDLCEGEVSRGQDLVVTSLLFLPGEQGTIHNRLMMSRLSQNFLILQVWRKDKLVGIAKVGTDSIHEAYQSGETQSNQCLTFYDGVIDVVDIFEGQKVAELKIKVRVGSEKFIQPPEPSTTTTLCQQLSTSNSNNSKSVQTSFLENEINKEDNSDRTPDVNDNHCANATDDSIEEITNKSDGKDECDEIINTVNVEISIEEARNLPCLKSEGGKIEPEVYVTLLEHSSNLATQIQTGTCPIWNYVVTTKLDIQYIRNPRKYLILKVWHFRGESNKETRDADRDQVLGYVAVDLTPLNLTSFSMVSGWYNITDWMGKCRGQVKLSVTPLQPIPGQHQDCLTEQDDFNESSVCGNDEMDYYATAQYSKYPSHLVPHNELLIRSRHKSNPDLSLISETSQGYKEPCSYWREPDHIKGGEVGGSASISMLERTLNSHLADLSSLTKGWLGADKSSYTLGDSTNRTFTIDEADRNDSVILIDPINDEGLQTAEQAVQKNLENLRNFMKQGAGIMAASGRSSRTSILSEDLPRDDQPNLMDLGLVLEDLDHILDLDTDRSRSKGTADNAAIEKQNPYKNL